MILERTLCVIKPEAFGRRSEICQYILENSPLTIVEYLDRVMESRDVEALYADDLSSELLLAAKMHLVGKAVRVCVIEGENAIEVFQDLSGRHFDSAKCDNGTIRKVFAIPGTVQYGSVTYFLNAVHKTSRLEVGPALAWYERIRKEEDPGA